MNIPTISEEKFWRKIENRKYEDKEIVEWIEDFFMRKRGYVFNFPSPGTPVVLLVSGGLDSTITWGILMEHYGLKVYPLFLHRGKDRKKREKEAIIFFTKFFRQRYPDLFVNPVEYTTHLPPPEVERKLTLENLHPKYILNHYREYFALGVTPYLFPYYGAMYAHLLHGTRNLPIDTIFSAVAVGDGTVVPSQTFTAQRTTLLDICFATADYSWQYASFALEKEIGHWLEKKDLMKLGDDLGMPLEKTWSCYESKVIQCGSCLTCCSRQLEFSKAGVADQTEYITDLEGGMRTNIYLTIKNILVSVEDSTLKVLYVLKKFLRGGELNEKVY